MEKFSKANRVINFVIIGVLLLIVLWPVVRWGIIYLGFAMGESPPKPSIKEAEFPFELIYEIKGEQHTISDIVVCKYEGISINEGDGKKYRLWSANVKSTGENYVVLFEKGDSKTVFSVGNGDYYMGETDKVNWGVSFMTFKENGSRIESQRIPEEYYAKVISWNPSAPITNIFGK